MFDINDWKGLCNLEVFWEPEDSLTADCACFKGYDWMDVIEQMLTWGITSAKSIKNVQTDYPDFNKEAFLAQFNSYAIAIYGD